MVTRRRSIPAIHPDDGHRLAIIAVAGTYYQFNPPTALKDLPVGAFADQMRIKAAPLRPTTDPAAVAAYDDLLAGLNALFDADRRGTDVRPALSLVAARATHFARLRAIKGAENLAHAARERARTAGLSPITTRSLTPGR